MAEFVVNKDVETDTPNVEVTITPNTALKPGRHRYRLIVVDDSGNKSAPDEVVVIIADNDAPTAVISAPTSVGVGAAFELDGRRSFDTGGGKIVRYVWTYLGPER